MEIIFMPSETMPFPPPLPQDFLMITFFTIDKSIDDATY
jgi:hypothetical protein